MAEHLAELAAASDDGHPDFYGDGGPVTALEERVADLLGKESAVFFPTGTMAQQVALRFGAELTGRRTVALHPLGHQEVCEGHAFSRLSGLRSVWPTIERRNPTAEEILALAEPVGSVVIELPLRDAGFILPTWDELAAVREATRVHGALLHFDGARIWESTPYLGRSLSEVAGLAESVYVSFYKTLGGMSGAALAGSAELAAYARVWRHRYGGQVFQQWPYALAAMIGLDRELPLIPGYVEHARTVASALAELPGAKVLPEPPHTQRFRFWLPYSAKALNEAALGLAEDTKTWFAGQWVDAEVPGMAFAEITVAGPGLEWTREDIHAVGARFLNRVAAG